MSSTCNVPFPIPTQGNLASGMNVNVISEQICLLLISTWSTTRQSGRFDKHIGMEFGPKKFKH